MTLYQTFLFWITIVSGITMCRLLYKYIEYIFYIIIVSIIIAGWTVIVYVVLTHLEILLNLLLNLMV